MSNLVDFRPEDVNDGFLFMEPGIHKNVKLCSIIYEIIDRNGTEYVKYTFTKINEDGLEEKYVYRQKWGAGTKLTFAANTLHHILSAALDLKINYPDLEKQLNIKEISDSINISNNSDKLYEIKPKGKSAFVGNIIIAIINLSPTIEYAVKCFDFIRSKQSPEKTCAIKLSQTVYLGKTKVGFNLINHPFMDSNPEGIKLRWNPDIDIEKPKNDNGVLNIPSYESFSGESNIPENTSDNFDLF